MAAMNQLAILEKVYDLTKALYPALKQFPKAERYTLAADIRNTLYNLMRLIVRANKERNKLPWMWQADAELELLRRLVMLSADLGFLAHKKHMQVGEMLGEIGRMLGGWIRSATQHR